MTENAIPVDIAGRIYQIKAKEGEDYLQNLARMVNERMDEVVKATKAVDSLRISDMAALNLADAYCKVKVEYEKQIRELELERARLQELIDNALINKNTLPDT